MHATYMKVISNTTIDKLYCNKIIKKIIDNIEYAADKGKFELEFDIETYIDSKNISENTFKHIKMNIFKILIELGYRVINDKKYTYSYISWE